jgi:hypothetical protein
VCHRQRLKDRHSGLAPKVNLRLDRLLRIEMVEVDEIKEIG